MENKKTIGLSSAQAEESKKKYGTNALSVKDGASFWEMYKEAFDDIWIKILCGALLLQLLIYFLSFIWPEYFHQDLIEILGVAIAIFLATFVGTLQNYRNNQQFNTLQAEAAKIITKVYRDDKVREMPIDDIVKGDVILLQAGDQVPVDGVIIEGSCKVNQASLNGESCDETKTLSDLPIDTTVKCEDFANPNWIFRGSVVTSGEVLVEAEIIGDNTVLGGISEALGASSKPSPSAEKMEVLAAQIGKLGVAGAAIAVVANLLFELLGLGSFTFASMLALAIQNVMLFVSIIIMAVPEGLPLMSALVSSMNSERMLKENILVRHSDSIETAGYMNRLFSDKTGTITEGILSVVDWIDGNGNIIADLNELDKELKDELIKGIGLNNDALSSDGKAIGSNGTDRALMNYLISIEEDSLDRSVVIQKNPFDSHKKYSEIILQDCSYIKGAPDYFIDKCRYYMDLDGSIKPFTDANRERVEIAMHDQMARSMRLLLIMKKDLEHSEIPIYLGIVCIRDNVRSDVAQTVKTMKRAGCEVVMVTGDNAKTASAIAKEAGILETPEDLILTSDELAKIDDEELKRILPDLRVVSRAKPMDKKRLVDLAQSLNYVVGMTGDGVNDSPALKSADVGFSMGDGTSVAKEASDIVIVNNSLTSIANALKYGRTMTKSVQKFIIFQLTVNVATILMNVIAPFLGFTEPFTIVQILWINLIMDTLAALAFGEEPALDRYMKEKPISRKAPVLTKYMIQSIATAAIYIAIVSAILYKAPDFLASIGLTDEPMVRTFVFTFFIYAVIFNSLNTRTTEFNIFEHITENRKFIIVMTMIFVLQTVLIYLAGAVFNTVPIPMPALFIAMGLGVLIIPIDIIKKIIVKNLNG